MLVIDTSEALHIRRSGRSIRMQVVPSRRIGVDDAQLWPARRLGRFFVRDSCFASA